MIVIAKTGSTLPEIADEFGDFEAWFAAGLGIPVRELTVVSVFEGPASQLPPAADCRAVIVTGSAALVTDRAEWSERTGRWMRDVLEADRPMLAVCYGHQLLADVLDGEVARNPRGREIGTIDVSLTETGTSDELLGGLAPAFRVQSTHVESVTKLPAGAVRLATSELDPNQAFRIEGSQTWAVQFHPEFSAPIIKRYIAARREPISSEGLDSDALLASATESPAGHTILRRFAELLG